MADDLDALISQHVTPNAAAPAADDLDALIAQHTAPKFTGKPEIEAEQKRMLDETGFGGRLLAGIGHGMYNTHLNIADMMGHLPGFERVDPEQWKQQEEVAAPLLRDAAGNFGDLTGQTALLLPAGLGAETAVASAAKVLAPAASATFAPLLTTVAGNAAQGAIAAGPGKRAEGALLAGMTGPVLNLLSGGLTALPRALKGLGVKAASPLFPGASSEAIANALENGVVAPGRTAETIAERAAGARGKAGQELSGLVSQADSLGAQGPEVQALADVLRAKATGLESNTMNPAIPNAYKRAADRVLAKAGPEGRLSLGQNEALKRDLQEVVKYGRPEPKGLERAKADIASTFRQGTEDALRSAAESNPDLVPLAERFGPLKDKAGLAIEAAQAAEKGAKPGPFGKMADRLSLLGALGGGFLHGGPKGALVGVPLAVGEHLLRTRGPSAAAWGSYGLGKGLGWLGNKLALGPAAGEAAARASFLPATRAGLSQTDEGSDFQRALALMLSGGAQTHASQ